MYSKSLVKLIDEALIPAIILIAAKILGVTFVNYFYSLSWFFQGSAITYKTMREFLLANSYSNLVMYSVILFGLSWVLIRAHYLHETHVHPKLAAQLARWNLAHLVEGTFEIYHEALVWISYLWLTTLLFGVESYFGLSYLWVFGLSLLFACVATVLFVADVEKEFGFTKEINK